MQPYLKKWLLLLGCCSFLFFDGISQNTTFSSTLTKPSSAQQAPKDTIRDISVTTNIVGPFSFDLEAAINKNNSFGLMGRHISGNFFGRTAISSFTGEWRHYFHPKEILSGFYIAPYVKYRFRHDSDREDGGWFTRDKDAYAYFLGGGCTGGFQKVYKSGFVLNLYGGPGYRPLIKKKILLGSEATFDGINEIDFRLGAAIGYAF